VWASMAVRWQKPRPPNRRGSAIWAAMASSLTRPLDQGEHSSTQLGLHTREGRRKDITRDDTSEMRHAGLEGGAQDEGLVLKGEGQGQ
jgi:hypothetical protein